MKKGKYEIVITDTETGTIQSRFTVDQVKFTEEFGIAKMGNLAPKLEYNSQRRLLIQGWTGCPSYDSFQTD